MDAQPIEECVTLKHLENLLKTYGRPGVNITIQLGTVKRYGSDLGMFTYTISERAYNSMYQFMFYSNEWTQRVLDMYHMYDYDNGDTLFRVNQDGSKYIDTSRTIANMVMLTRSSQEQTRVAVDDVASPPFDFHVTVTKASANAGCGDGTVVEKPTFLNDHKSDKLFASRRVHIEEINLVFNNSFRVVLQQQTFLDTLKIIHTACVRVSMAPTDSAVTNEAFTLFSQPDAGTVLRTLRAMEESAVVGADKELTSTDMVAIATASAVVKPVSSNMLVLDF